MSEPQSNRRLVTALIAVTLASCTSGIDEPPLLPIRVGLMVPFTGSANANAQIWWKAAELAREQINSSGGVYGGRQLEFALRNSCSDGNSSMVAVSDLLAFSDDECNERLTLGDVTCDDLRTAAVCKPSSGCEGACAPPLVCVENDCVLPDDESYIEEEAVAAIIGPVRSASVEPTLAVAAERGVVQISWTATAPSLTRADTTTNDLFFRTIPNDRDQGKVLGQIALHGFDPDVYPPPTTPAVSPERIGACPEMLVAHVGDNYGTELKDAVLAAYDGLPLCQGFSVDGECIPIPGAGGNLNGNVVGIVAMQDETEVAGVDAADALADAYLAAGSGHNFVANPKTCLVFIAFPNDPASESFLTRFYARLDDRKDSEQTTNPGFQFDIQITVTDAYAADDAAEQLFDIGESLRGVICLLGELGCLADFDVVGSVATRANNFAYSKFSNAYHARWGEFPGSRTAHIFDAVILLGLAFAKTYSDDAGALPDGPTLAAALRAVSSPGSGALQDGRFFGSMAYDLALDEGGINYRGASGEVDFDEYGDVVGNFSIFRPARKGNASYIEEIALFPDCLLLAPNGTGCDL